MLPNHSWETEWFVKPWRTNQLAYKTAMAHLTCTLPSVGSVSWTDLSIPLSFSKPGNERPWQARSSCGLHTFLFLSSHTLKAMASLICVFFLLLQQPHSSTGMFGFKLKGLLLQWKEMPLPCGKKMILCVCAFTSAGGFVTLLTHRRWA